MDVAFLLKRELGFLVYLNVCKYLTPEDHTHNFNVSQISILCTRKRKGNDGHKINVKHKIILRKKLLIIKLNMEFKGFL